MVRTLLMGPVEGGGREADFSTAAASAPPPLEMASFGLVREERAMLRGVSSSGLWFAALRVVWSGSLAANEVKSWVPRTWAAACCRTARSSE